MKRLLQLLRSWGPMLVVVTGLTGAGLVYRKEIGQWIRPVAAPLLRDIALSLPDTAVAKWANDWANVDSPVSVGPFAIQVSYGRSESSDSSMELAFDVRDESGLPIEGAQLKVDATAPPVFVETAPGRYATQIEAPAEGEQELNGQVRTVDLRVADFSLRVTADRARIAAANGDIAYWTCSMHPSVKSEGRGTCPICSMDLVSVTRAELESGVITVDAQRRQLIGVRTEEVRRAPMAREIRAVGVVTPDETKRTDVTPKFPAWIGEVYADFEGQTVERGDALFTFYSPELWSTQQEYLEAARRERDNPTRRNLVLESAETRLKLWGIDAGELQAIRERDKPAEFLPFVSPASGTILEKSIVAGSAVEAGQTLYQIADLSTVWIDAALFEQELSLISPGQQVTVSVSYLPGNEFSGVVSFVHPYLDAASRTGRIRVAAPNPDGVLKPNMYATVSIAIAMGDRLAVPEGAVIYAGKSRVVFVDLGDGRLEPRVVQVGYRTAELVEVLEGLEEGETVVTSGNFLIAAESKLKSGIEKW